MPPRTPFAARPKRAGCSASASRREWRPAPMCWTLTWRSCRPSWIEPRRSPARTSPMPGWRGRWANERHHGDRSHETLRRLRRRRSADVRGRPGRGVRIPRQQRGRQVDDDPDAVRPAETDRRYGGGRRRRCQPRSGRRQAPHRIHVAALFALRTADRRSEHPLLRRHLRPRSRPLRGAPPLRPRHGGPSPPGAHARRRPGGRVASAARARLRDSPRAAHRLSRRADRRRRPALPPRVLGPDRPPLRVGRDRPRDDALSRRGGALPSAGDHSRRPARRSRNDRPAEARVCRSRDPRSARGESGGNDAAARSDAGHREDERVRHVRACAAEGRTRTARAQEPARSGRRRGDVDRGGAAVARRRLPRSGRAGGIAMRKMVAVSRKEFRQIWRDTRTLMTLLFVPAFFLLLYGYALNFDIRHVGLAVDDRDRTIESRALIAAFVNSGYFDLVASVDAAGTTRLMNRNDVGAALVIPSGLGRAVRTAGPAAVQVLLNGDNANTATTVMGYALTIIRSESARYRPATAPSAPLLPAEPRVWYNPALRSTLFLVPGLIAYIAMLTALVSTALSIVREKERGAIEQVRMASLDTAAFVAGNAGPY